MASVVPAFDKTAHVRPSLTFTALRRAALAAAVCAAGVFANPFADTAKASGDKVFTIGYTVSLNGLLLGRGDFAGRVSKGAYRLKGKARLTGIAGMLFDYSASGEVDGRLGQRQHRPRSFVSSASEANQKQVVRMGFSRGKVARLALNPQVNPSRDRIKVRDAHKRGVVDPMTAMILPAGKNGGIDASTCNRTIPVFNGRERFDLRLNYKGVRTVGSSRSAGYRGQVVICQALYRPVAGHRQGRSEVNYYANAKSMEVWLAPAGDTGLMVPYRMVLPTPLGTGVIQATRFTTSDARASRTSAAR